ncbi:unnamed protein product [Arctia plantaginis]|uniref:Uncharacterized protein n=1 Tax=Arctia plantaginis TaxID=874455 RepID=A0A8S0ZG86_ARCPL|nr:unnamed protein product [Arctia plantaginis]
MPLPALSQSLCFSHVGSLPGQYTRGTTNASHRDARITAPCEEVCAAFARVVIVRRCRHRSLSQSVCRSVGVMLTEHEACEALGRATRRDCAPSLARYVGHEIFSRAAVNRWRHAAHRCLAPQPRDTNLRDLTYTLICTTFAHKALPYRIIMVFN